MSMRAATPRSPCQASREATIELLRIPILILNKREPHTLYNWGFLCPSETASSPTYCWSGGRLMDSILRQYVLRRNDS